MKSFFKQVLAVFFGIILFFCFVTATIIFFSATKYAEQFSISQIKNGNKVLEINFENQIIETASESPVTFTTLGEAPKLYLHEIIKIIKRAEKNKDIKGISLKSNDLNAGLTQIKEIRDAVKSFKESGKFVYSYQKSVGQKNYYLNSVSDSIFQNPMGSIDFKGIATEVVFYKKLAEKYGVSFDVVKHGEYKGSVEPFTRESLSNGNRSQIQLLINNLWDSILTEISIDRNVSIGKLNDIANNLLGNSPENAKKSGLIDEIISEADYIYFLKSKLGQPIEEELNTISLNDLRNELIVNKSGEEVAVLSMSGSILSGNGYNQIQSDYYKAIINEINKNEKIKAVVLRINSPGGSAIASDEIYEALLQLKKEKPIYASFGDLSASGGYYIGMAADSIYARPSSILGSIGVYGIMPNISKLANKNGVSVSVVKTNENSLGYSPIKGLTETKKKRLEEEVGIIYNRFVSIVAKNRNFSSEKTDSLAGGRVYSGTLAKKLNLIDGFASLEETISKIANHNGINKYHISYYPSVEIDIFSSLQSEFKLLLLKETGYLYNKLNPLTDYIYSLDNPKARIQAKLPYQLNFN